jgi:hypothetical protein
MARFKQGSKPTGPSLQVQNRRRIQKMLSSDREAIRHARAYAATRDGFGLLDESEQERRLTEAVENRIQRRIDGGLYVSCTYPEFVGYLPPSFYGQTGHLKDPEKEKRLNRQLEALRRESAGDDDDDDDDEEDLPPSKTEENTKKQMKISEFLPFAENHGTRLSKDNSAPGHEDSADKDKSDKAATAGRRSQGRNPTPHTLKRKRVDTSNDNKKEAITWRVVSRGEPLPPGSPVANLEQRKPKINPWLGRVVFRGQVLTEDSKDEE